MIEGIRAGQGRSAERSVYQRIMGYLSQSEMNHRIKAQSNAAGRIKETEDAQHYANLSTRKSETRMTGAETKKHRQSEMTNNTRGRRVVRSRISLRGIGMSSMVAISKLKMTYRRESGERQSRGN